MPPGAWPLVGRDEELALARDAVEGGGSGLVVTGAAGVGKTRVAEELLAELAASGARVVRLLATRAAATIPFGAAASLLADLSDDSEATDLASEIAAAHQALRSRTSTDPLVIGVDDAHLLDDATAQLVYHLARAGDAKLVVTARSADRAPPYVEALWQEQLCRRLELQPLSRDEVSHLLSAALDGQIEQHSADSFWKVTAGNVLFLQELCRDALANGFLARQHGVWTWTGAPVLGARLQELLDLRIGQLNGAARQAAALLALGEPLPRWVLDDLLPGNAVADLEALALAEVAEEQGVVLVRLAHPLYAESLRGRLGPLETSDLYARLADGLGADSANPDDRLRVAVWSVSSGRPVASGFLAEAATEALQRGDPALAERLARAASPDPMGQLVLGEALAGLRRGDEAEEVLQPLSRLPAPSSVSAVPDGTPTDPSWPTRVAVARLVAHRSSTAPVDAARKLTHAALVAEDPGERDLLKAALADTLGFRGHTVEAGERAARLLDSPNPDARQIALGPAVIWLLRSGRAEDAVVAGRRVLDDALATMPLRPQAADVIFGSLGAALLASGRLDELDALCAAALAPPWDQLAGTHATVAFLQGYAALLRGQPITATKSLREAVLGFRRAGATGHQAFAVALLAEAEALAGQAEQSQLTWAALPETLRDNLPVDLRRSAVWVEYVQDGDTTFAAAQAVEWADDAAKTFSRFFELTLAYTALQLGATDQAHRVAEVATGIQGALAETIGEHAAALIRRDADALERAAVSFQRLGLRLFAAEAFVHAAMAHRRSSSTIRATSASGRAAALRAECEGARTPLLAQGGIVADLTPREREVALLAARGMSSRQIGERLGVSVRTVDNQLGRVYSKLAVSGRGELADLLDQLGD